MDFAKLQSAGNDFVFVDTRNHAARVDARTARVMLDRRRGVGGDQLLALKPAARRGADYGLRIFNPDGSQAEMCGNGVLASAHHLARGRRPLAFDTRAGIIRASAPPRIEVDMGPPLLRVLGKTLRVCGRSLTVHCVSMGNPHCVVFVDRLDRFPVAAFGPALERHPFFPRRTNVEFVELLRARPAPRARVRVWERGAGLTLSCGTGACAALAAGVLTGRLARRARLLFPGGTLTARWPADGHIYLSSDSVSTVFRGRFIQQ